MMSINGSNYGNSATLQDQNARAVEHADLGSASTSSLKEIRFF